MNFEKHYDRLDKHERLIKDAQGYMQACVDIALQDDELTFDQKYELWSKYSQKGHREWYIGTNDLDKFPVTGRLFEDSRINYFSRHEIVDLDRMIGFMEDDERYTDKVEAVKKEWMANNLGSFTYDW